MQKKHLLNGIIGIISFMTIFGLISCSSFSSQEVEAVDVDGDGFISFPQELPGSFPTPDPEKNFIQAVSVVQDPITEEHIQCTSDYHGKQGNNPWVNLNHPSLSSVYVLRLDNKGNMWIGTSGEGVAMFDGEKWHHWYLDSETPIPYDSVLGIGAANITAIAAIDYEPITGAKPVTEINHKGAILVFSDGENAWKDLEAPFDVGKNDDYMPGLAVSNQGEIFVPFVTKEAFQQDEDQTSGKNSSGITGLINDLFSPNNTTESEFVFKGKLGIFSDGEWAIKDMPTPPPMGMNDAEVDSNGNYWVATNGAGVWMYDGQDWKIFSAWQGQLPWDKVTGISATEEGFIWASTPIGISLLHPNGTSSVMRKEDYPFSNEPLEDIAIDMSNRLWILSEDQISIYNGAQWSLIEPRGYSQVRNWSYNIAFDRDGCGWIVFSGGSGAGIFRNQINMEPGDYSEIISMGSN